MTKRVYAILIGVALTLATASTSHAMSTFVSLSVEPEWPTTSTPGNVLLYKVTAVVRAESDQFRKIRDLVQQRSREKEDVG